MANPSVSTSRRQRLAFMNTQTDYMVRGQLPHADGLKDDYQSKQHKTNPPGYQSRSCQVDQAYKNIQ
ncbi:MAG: hypothetical protein EOM12_06030 [Verrucomicrobiae bacterium]|nr:hypothetical protein [Verrucomicrobiae bacterium]